MKLTQVRQKDENGCFVAALATCLGKSYKKTYKLCYPNRDIRWSSHGSDMYHAYDTIYELLSVKETKRKHFSEFKRDTIVFIKWSACPSLAHTIVWDYLNQKVIDPGRIIPRRMRIYEKQIYAAFYFDRLNGD